MFLCYLVAYFSPKLQCEFLSSPPTDNIQNPQTHLQFIQLHQTIKLCLCYQNKSLTGDARSARSYRDELDIVKEKASKVDKLERQLQSYKDKMHELDFYKARVDVRLCFEKNGCNTNFIYCEYEFYIYGTIILIAIAQI